MPTAIAVTVFTDAETWLRENLGDMHSDNISCMRRSSNLDLDGSTKYVDEEENVFKECSLEDHVEALRKMTSAVGNTLWVGGMKSPHDLLEPGNWDVEVVDAYWQFLVHGEVIYG